MGLDYDIYGLSRSTVKPGNEASLHVELALPPNHQVHRPHNVSLFTNSEVAQ